jgi:methylglutaconyl-CoA hydratase
VSDDIIISTASQIITITLNRPEKRNALHPPMIKALTRALRDFAADDSRILILRGAGADFCAGGDIAWMQKMALASKTENYDDAQALADLLSQLYFYPKPTIVLVQGRVLGGGVGLVAAADIAIASEESEFGLPEVKLGLTPSMVSPYVINAIGERAAHYYFLTGETFNAKTAQEKGLIHEVVKTTTLEERGEVITQMLLQNSPQALVSAKHLIHAVSKEKISTQLAQETAEHLAELRKTPEAQEGLSAFLQKRKPLWR